MIYISLNRFAAIIICVIGAALFLGRSFTIAQNRRIPKDYWFADWKWINTAAKEILDDRKLLNPENPAAPDSNWMKEQLLLRITRAVNDIELTNSDDGTYEINLTKTEAPKWFDELERKRNEARNGSPQPSPR